MVEQRKLIMAGQHSLTRTICLNQIPRCIGAAYAQRKPESQQTDRLQSARLQHYPKGNAHPNTAVFLFVLLPANCSWVI